MVDSTNSPTPNAPATEAASTALLRVALRNGPEAMKLWLTARTTDTHALLEATHRGPEGMTVLEYSNMLHDVADHETRQLQHHPLFGGING